MAWRRAGIGRATGRAADDHSGRAWAATNNDGGIIYIGTRIKVVNKKITEVETSFNKHALSPNWLMRQAA